jgi:Secretion system C-terminal sorting domain
MKKITISIFTFLLTLGASAQLVTIQGTNQFPVAGNIIQYTNANAFGFDAAGVGPVTTKVWDFSGLSTVGAVTNFTYVNPATLTAANGADKYPNATIARSETGATGYFYYQNTATNIDRLGFFAASNNWGVYTGGTKATEFKFPITAGQSVNSTYAGDFAPFGIGEDSVNITDGTVSITADMQGTMILPSATFGTNTTYTNVLRLHVIESFHIKTFAFGTVIQDNIIADDYFYWFVESVKGALFIKGITTQDGTAQPTVLRYQKTPNPLSVTTNNIETIATISPNPSNGVLNLKTLSNNFENSNIEIYNTIGSLIYKTDLKQNSTDIDISSEAKGIYFIKISNDNKTQTQKIILK